MYWALYSSVFLFWSYLPFFTCDYVKVVIYPLPDMMKSGPSQRSMCKLEMKVTVCSDSSMACWYACTFTMHTARVHCTVHIVFLPCITGDVSHFADRRRANVSLLTCSSL